MDLEEYFSKLKDAKTNSNKNPYLHDGRYLVRVTNAVMLEKVRATGKPAFVLEFTIEKSEGPTVTLATGVKVSPNAVGSSGSWFQNLADEAVGFGALIGFAAAITGAEAEDPEFLGSVKQFMTAVVKGLPNEKGEYIKDAPSAIAGWLVPVEVVTIKTKKEKDFSLFKWGMKIEEQS